MLFSVENLHKAFPVHGSRAVVHAVNGVSLTIERGETLGLVGESGSGKSTIGRCLLRLIEPSSGTVRFRGEDITHLPQKALRALRPKFQMVFQDPYASLNPRWTVRRTLDEPLLLMGMPAADRRDRIRELLELVRLERVHLNRYPHQMSGGQQQRVGIARALATEPEFVVLDEPTSSLDLSVRAEIVDLLRDLQQRLGVAYLFISHDLATVRSICARIQVLYLGRTVEVGRSAEVFRHPRHPYTRALLSAILPPNPRAGRVRYALQGEIPSPLYLPSGCFLHGRCPEAIGECSRVTPEPVPFEDLHTADCLRARELASRPEWGGEIVRSGTQSPGGSRDP